MLHKLVIELIVQTKLRPLIQRISVKLGQRILVKLDGN